MAANQKNDQSEFTGFSAAKKPSTDLDQTILPNETENLVVISNNHELSTNSEALNPLSSKHDLTDRATNNTRPVVALEDKDKTLQTSSLRDSDHVMPGNYKKQSLDKPTDEAVRMFNNCKIDNDLLSPKDDTNNNEDRNAFHAANKDQPVNLFAKLPNELIQEIILCSHMQIPPCKEWQKHISTLAQKSLKQLAISFDTQQDAIIILHRQYLLLKNEARDAVWTTVQASHSPLSALFYSVLDQMIEDDNLQNLWSSLLIQRPLLENADEIRQWMDTEQVSSIVELSYASGDMTRIPREIRQLQQVVSIGLDRNQITHIPAEIRQLQQLQYLDINNNCIMQIPAEIGQLRQLEYFYLNNNLIKHIPGEIGQLQQLLTLSLEDNRVTQIPTEIGQLQQLQRLYLDNNQITRIPAEIGQLHQLEYLYLNKNHITQLPVEIGRLQQLKYLFGNDNQLMQIPAEIGQLQQLLTLSLDNNNITQIPAEIEQLQQLQQLNLENNRITQIPVGIGQLVQLEYLNLKKNPITHILADKGWLQQLIHYLIDNN